MREVGLSATELGPEGFLPSEPDELTALLASNGLSCVGIFVPVLLHDADHDPLADIAGPLDALIACGADVLVLAAATGADGYDSRPTLERQPMGHAAGQSRPARRCGRRPRCARRAAPARRNHGRDPQRCGPGTAGREHQAVPGHRPSAHRRDGSACADPAGAGPNRPRTPQGCRRGACRSRAGRGTHVHRGGAQGHVHAARRRAMSISRAS